MKKNLLNLLVASTTVAVIGLGVAACNHGNDGSSLQQAPATEAAVPATEAAPAQESAPAAEATSPATPDAIQVRPAPAPMQTAPSPRQSTKTERAAPINNNTPVQGTPASGNMQK